MLLVANFHIYLFIGVGGFAIGLPIQALVNTVINNNNNNDINGQ